MKKIPASIDELMWLMADKRDSSALDSFSARYPEYHDELIRRVNIIQDMKLSKPTVETAFIPPFRGVKPTPLASPRFKFARYGLAGVGLVGVCFAAFLGTKNYIVKPPETKTETIRKVVSTPSDKVMMSVTAPETTLDKVKHPELGPKDTKPDGLRQRINPADVVVTLSADHSRLFSLLRQIEAQSGLVLTPAPGLANDTISSEYNRMSALDVVYDLGETLGFSVVEDGENHYLLIPHSNGESTGNIDVSENEMPVVRKTPSAKQPAAEPQAQPTQQPTKTPRETAPSTAPETAQKPVAKESSGSGNQGNETKAAEVSADPAKNDAKAKTDAKKVGSPAGKSNSNPPKHVEKVSQSGKKKKKKDG